MSKFLIQYEFNNSILKTIIPGDSYREAEDRFIGTFGNLPIIEMGLMESKKN